MRANGLQSLCVHCVLQLRHNGEAWECGGSERRVAARSRGCVQLTFSAVGHAFSWFGPLTRWRVRACDLYDSAALG